MKRTTKKLTGVGLEIFLRRFFSSYSGIDPDLVRRLSADGAKTFASVRVRRMAWHDWRSKPQLEPVSRQSAAAAILKTPMAVPPPPGVTVPAKPPSSAPPMEAPPTPEAGAFDPYAIGLIPTYQREGSDGLLAKLADVTTVDHLRKMARSQQVPLPADLRGPDADIEAIRSAIVAAVGKRIADRRAAAG